MLLTKSDHMDSRNSQRFTVNLGFNSITIDCDNSGTPLTMC